MDTVTLQFQNMNLLWAFARTLKVQQFKVDTKKICITCKCDEKHMLEALIIFKANYYLLKIRPNLNPGTV